MEAVTEDSRRVRPGTLFAAIQGEKSDGHTYAAGAVQTGAAAILGAREGLHEIEGRPYIYTPRPREAVGRIAHALAGDPSRHMTVIGITGTNGKSSTAYLTQAILNHAGYRAANLGTMGYDIGGETLPAAHTTPFGEELGRIFARAREAGMSHVVMEASSHALDQERVAGIHFQGAAFTNLTQDHLDYHADMDAYCQAKLKLFTRLEGDAPVAVVNTDDPAAPRFIGASPVPCITYGQKADCSAIQIQTRMDGTVFALRTPWGEGDAFLRLLGQHNVSNALCAAALCGGLGLSFTQIVEGLASLASVPGRFQPIDAGQDFYVIVDYAHTDDGLRNSLEAARKICKGRIITVFGCGGDRDKGKRPKMGAVAGALSDFILLTSDNPRTEDPHRILLDAEVGLQRANRQKGDDYVVLLDRAEAIHHAIALAAPGDLVMIAGKGHEDYQILGTERIHFDDREVARQALEARLQ